MNSTHEMKSTIYQQDRDNGSRNQLGDGESTYERLSVGNFDASSLTIQPAFKNGEDRITKLKNLNSGKVFRRGRSNAKKSW